MDEKISKNILLKELGGKMGKTNYFFIFSVVFFIISVYYLGHSMGSLKGFQDGIELGKRGNCFECDVTLEYCMNTLQYCYDACCVNCCGAEKLYGD